MNRIKKTEGNTPKQILFATEPQLAISITVSDANMVGESGKKILKAGTPMTGDLTNRNTPFAKATTTDSKSNAIGVLLHDVDVTGGTNNATLLIFGFVNLDKLESDVVTLIDEPVKDTLDIKFLK